MKKKAVIIISAAALLLAIGCSALLEEAVTLVKRGFVMEAYILKSELPVRPTATATAMPRETLEAYPVKTEAPAVQTEATAAPVSEDSGTNLSLDPYQLGDETIYRMDGTDYLTLMPYSQSVDVMVGVTNSANRFKGLAEENPGVKFYAYYITRSQTLDWYEQKSEVSVFDYAAMFEELVTSSGVAFGKFDIPDFDYYKETGYKTDFHVNYKGSDAIYGDVYAMLSKDFELGERVMPKDTLEFDDLRILGDIVFHTDSGARNPYFYNDDGTIKQDVLDAEFTHDEMDVFKVYDYDIGDYKSYIKDKEVIIGLEEEYAAGQINRSPTAGHQFSYYGGQTDMVRFEFNQPDRPNLLICSDSQGRPSRKLIASHFNTTIYMDEAQYRAADVSALIAEYDIDAVLLIGQHSMFEDY